MVGRAGRPTRRQHGPADRPLDSKHDHPARPRRARTRLAVGPGHLAPALSDTPASRALRRVPPSAAAVGGGIIPAVGGRTVLRFTEFDAATCGQGDRPMKTETTRRDVLKGGLAMAGLGVIGLPEWGVPGARAGRDPRPVHRPAGADRAEADPGPADHRRPLHRRLLHADRRVSSRPSTTGTPTSTRRRTGLQVSGLVNEPLALSLDDLRAMPGRELVFGFECSGNRGPLNGLSSNGRWTGVPLRAVLERAGIQDGAREFVFFGADHGEEEVEFRGRTYTVDQQYGRSLPRDRALSDEPLLAYALNGEPLTAHQGRPLRPPRARLVRRAQRQVPLRDPRAGRPVPREVPGALVPHLEGRDGQRRDEVEGDRHHPHAAQVVHRPRHGARRPPQRVRRDHARRNADPLGRGEGGRRGTGSRRRSTPRPRARGTPGSSSTTRGRARLPASTRSRRGPRTRAGTCSRRRRSSK